MFDPDSRWHFVSTIPRGPRAKVMAASFPSVPKWYAQAKGKGNISHISFHAQDGVFFNYETSEKARTVSNKTETTYSQGCVIATYGTKTHGGKIAYGPGVISTCRGGKDKPSCQAIAGGLGVAFAPVAAGHEQASADEVTSEQYPLYHKQGRVDSELRDLLCEWQTQNGGNTIQPQQLAIRGIMITPIKRNNSVCGTELKGPTPVSTFSYTGTVEDVSLNYTVSVLTTPQRSLVPEITNVPTATPVCYVHDSDPFHGDSNRYCACDNYKTLPFLTSFTFSTQAAESQSCDYTTLPPRDANRDSIPSLTSATPTITLGPNLQGRDLTITKDFGPPITTTPNCQVCTPVGAYGYDASCYSLQGCVVPTAAVTLQAGSSPVHVGTVTGTALYTGVSNALETLCPTQAQNCTVDTAQIGSVTYIEDNTLFGDGFAGPQYYNPWGRMAPEPGETAWMDVQLEFKEGAGSQHHHQIKQIS
ncbi:Uu.00g007070.m01.CDS01 [Anthostomella pinea]|uniref:Uu.00g007020.m01.CDS01 n=1 Tax=Anthostomella pinea TaxID=933095 RepID=A0AAI8VL37_9PEZI|nr:Uu.00g007020.m01.CDS01 [Anthostomella pinea]CAJ2506577.1 Uu.00g007070.m01.CDS01 [Anthostomella pinea]